jgi:hypothetical protein
MFSLMLGAPEAQLTSANHIRGSGRMTAAGRALHTLQWSRCLFWLFPSNLLECFLTPFLLRSVVSEELIFSDVSESLSMAFIVSASSRRLADTPLSIISNETKQKLRYRKDHLGV